MNRSHLVLTVSLLVLVLAAGGAFANTFNVPGTVPTIQAAINEAVNGDVVVVAPGTYQENIDFKGKAITVRSTNPADPAVVATTIIDGNHQGTVVVFKTAETVASALLGFTIINGSGAPQDLVAWGGGIYCYKSSPTVANNVISDNVAVSWGGGVACYSSSSPTLSGNTISGNGALYGGGIYCVSNSSPKMDDNIISGNAAYAGGGMYCSDHSSPVLVNNAISDNEAHDGGDGGGLYCTGDSSPTLTTNTISGNTTEYGDGGGVACTNDSSPALTGNTISGNATGGATGDGDGGGVACMNNSSPALTGNTISGNAAHNSGGGVSCIYNSSPVLTENIISNNTARWGGGVSCYSASPTLTGNLISGNLANEISSGGWWWNGAAGGGGGGVECAYSSATLTNNIISGNSASGTNVGSPVGGGGVWCRNCSPTLTNNLITGNSSSVFGGGVHCFFSSPTLINNTVSRNSAPAGGGIWLLADSSPVIKNTIVALSTAGAGLERWGADNQPVVTYSDFYGNTGGNFISFPNPTGANGNISADPLFAGAVLGDFRLKSQSGRWNGSAWVSDSVSSPCLDTGDPASVYSLEPSPNGGRINMGYDGNTPHASKSPPPIVTDATPRGLSVGPTANIKITFNLDMARSTAQNALMINGVKAGTFGGEFSWVGRKMTFNPINNLRPATNFTIFLGTNVTSRAGVHMAKAFKWTFTTQGSAAGAVTVASVPTALGAQITINLTSAANISVSIRNLAGRDVATLQPGALTAGLHSLLWNGKSATGTKVPAGTYLLQVNARAADGSSCSALTSLRR